MKAQNRMRTKYRPYQRRIAPPPLEFRFASRTIGRSSYNDMSLQDVVEVSFSPIKSSKI